MEQSPQDVANAFVTEYAHEDGVERALVKFARRLSQESGYVVEESKIGGQRVRLPVFVELQTVLEIAQELISRSQARVL